VRRREKEKGKLPGFFVKFHCRRSGEVGGLQCKVVVAFECEMNGKDLKCAIYAPPKCPCVVDSFPKMKATNIWE
jgi:hypothetical protein